MSQYFTSKQMQIEGPSTQNFLLQSGPPPPPPPIPNDDKGLNTETITFFPPVIILHLYIHDGSISRTGPTTGHRTVDL